MLTVGDRFPEFRLQAAVGLEQGREFQEISQDSPPTSWAARGIDGPIRANAAITIEPLDGGTRSRVTFALDFDGHGIGVPLLPLVRRQARKGAPRSYENLKTLLEGAAGTLA